MLDRPASQTAEVLRNVVFVTSEVSSIIFELHQTLQLDLLQIMYSMDADG